MFSAKFWRSAFERAVKTAAQSAVVLFGANQVNVLSVDWEQIGAVVAGSALLSVLTSLASARITGHDDPSLV